MSTLTYSSPMLEFYAFASADAQAAVVNLIELTPPRGFKLIIQAIESSAPVAWGVLPVTAITGAATNPSSLFRVANPFAIISGVFAVGTAAAAPGGFLHSPAFRQPFAVNAVCDSIADQRFFFSNRLVNIALEVSIKGFLAKADFDTQERITIS